MTFAVTALARVERQLSTFAARREAAITQWCLHGPGDDIRELLDGLKRERAILERQRQWLLDGGTAGRPARRMPSLKKIAAFWNLPEPPACVRCGYESGDERWPATSMHLQRAHIIDRCFDGLDALCNVAPLCYGCHKSQPIFRPGDEAAALRWFGLERA